MATRSSPTVWRRWLARELKAQREGRGLSQRDVGKRCGWSGVKVSYLENGQQNVADDDLAALLPLYGVDRGRWPEFYDAARHARSKGWWEQYGTDVVPAWLSNYIGLEQGATHIRIVEPYIVPGLLQTREYITTNLASDAEPRTRKVVDTVAAVRLRRQEILHGEDAPELEVVIDESVLRRVVGSPAAMAEQLQHMIAVSELPNARLRVLPFEFGVTPTMIGAFRILSFSNEPSVLYLERREGAEYFDDEHIVDRHVLAFDHLAKEALSAEESHALISDVASAYGAGRDLRQ